MLLPLRRLFEKIVQRGDLVIVDAAGRAHRFGDGTGQQVSALIADAGTERGLVLDPGLSLGEAYMDGRLKILEGTIYEFLAILQEGIGPAMPPGWSRLTEQLRYLARRAEQYNPLERSGRNVRHHYDIEREFYDLFLDGHRQYSCGYFVEDGARGLEAAQLAKMRHIAAKMLIAPGQRVLDIGSGWGGLGAYLTRVAGADVTGITLSPQQLEFARRLAAREGLAGRLSFELLDYRQIGGTFDRIVSVGMFEHVGVTHFAEFFRAVREHLADDGVCLLHTIGRSDGPGHTNPFIAKYIFPGGYFPALSEIMAEVERSGLVVCDIEVLRLHYAETIRAWRERFGEKRARAVELKGERFCRMWEFYLAGSEAAFRFQGVVVYQIQLARHVGAVPITRGYIAEAEARLEAREEGMAGAAETAAGSRSLAR